MRKQNNPYHSKKKGSARPKLTIIGIIILVIGILITHYIGVPNLMEDRNADNPGLIAGMIGVVGGILMILFSLSKKNQKRISNGIDSAREAFEPDCNCCKCTNCDRNHNHWTHD